MKQAEARRPIAARNTGWAQKISGFLVRLGISPNQISVASIVFAALAGLAFAMADAGDVRALCLTLGVVLVQGRLLCNLFDGMVAVEGGRAAPDGPFWNEAPDRVADMLILVGTGYAAGLVSLGWAAACLAVLTAYVRELGRAVGAPADYSGPMAKQHRMALVSVAGLVAAAEPLWGWQGETLLYALWALVAGTAFTVLRRSWRLVRALKTMR